MESVGFTVESTPMSTLTVELAQQRDTFAAGEALEGIAGWNFESPPRWVEVRLFWQTAGKGDEDVTVVQTQRFDDPEAVDVQVFRFAVPSGPQSYSGTLLSLRWGVEVVAHKAKDTAVAHWTLLPAATKLEQVR